MPKEEIKRVSVLSKNAGSGRSLSNAEAVLEPVKVKEAKKGKFSPHGRTPKKLPWNNSSKFNFEEKRIRKSGSSVFETSKISAKS